MAERFDVVLHTERNEKFVLDDQHLEVTCRSLRLAEPRGRVVRRISSGAGQPQWERLRTGEHKRHARASTSSKWVAGNSKCQPSPVAETWSCAEPCRACGTNFMITR